MGQEPGIRLIRWRDSKLFNFAHTKGSGFPTIVKKRWCRTNGKWESLIVPTPSVIASYNKCMGGVDKMDSLIGRFPNRIKVQRWHMRVFLYLIDFIAANAWLLYRLEYPKQYPNDKKCLSLYDFKRSVSLSWMLENKRPGTRRIRRAKKTNKVPISLRYEDRKHLPKCSSGRTGRMRCEFCNKHTVTYCTKCDKFLCLHEWRNCYWDFHGGSATEINSETEDNDSNNASDADISDVDSGDQQPVLNDVDIGEQPVENAANENNEI